MDQKLMGTMMRPAEDGIVRNSLHIHLVCTSCCASLADLLRGELVKVLPVEINQPIHPFGLLSCELPSMGLGCHRLQQEEIPGRALRWQQSSLQT